LFLPVKISLISWKSAYIVSFCTILVLKVHKRNIQFNRNQWGTGDLIANWVRLKRIVVSLQLKKLKDE